MRWEILPGEGDPTFTENVDLFHTRVPQNSNSNSNALIKAFALTRPWLRLGSC